MIYDSLETIPPFRTKVQAVMGTSIRSEGRRELYPVGLIRGKVYPADKTSGAITTLAEADGIIEISEETEYLEAGKNDRRYTFGNIAPVDLMIVGGQCQHRPAGRSDWNEIQSDKYGVQPCGLSAMVAGIADIAGINLAGSGDDKLEVIRSTGISNAVLVKGYRREQGLIVRPESNIKAWKTCLKKNSEP